ncbi:trypsin inhibitor-like isoform X3 [Manduca sexta]|uniref:trypsin inhibitor-like isoform X3 n=1 Tax=Manduca sexta TaxID=7130 RepID=UPI00188E6368|nr:trypsin inhibitor-like isoform X3 [Manduca sexta]
MVKQLALLVIISVVLILGEVSAHVVKVREERCLRPILRGECTDYHTRYAYDPAVNKCVRFKYGGCGGSSNQFLHHHECRRACII